MMNRLSLTTMRAQQGVALLEVLIAAVILAIGLLGAMGLQARSYAAISESGMRAEATLAADALLGIMHNDRNPAVLATYAVDLEEEVPQSLAAWAQETRTRIPGARFGVTVTPQAGQSQIDIDIRWKRRRDDAESRHQVTAYALNP